jgi:hypothetical protein
MLGTASGAVHSSQAVDVAEQRESFLFRIEAEDRSAFRGVMRHGPEIDQAIGGDEERIEGAVGVFGKRVKAA